MRRFVLPIALPALLAAAAAPAAHAAEPWETANESFVCPDNQSSSPFYNGASASATYDSTFKLGHAIPAAMLDSYVPQGLGTWKDWGGPSKDLLLQAAYNDESHRAVLVGLVPGGGETNMVTLVGPGKQGYVDAHVGGVAVAGGFLYITGDEVDGLPTVLRFALPAVAAALANGGELKAEARQKVDVGRPGFKASFMSQQGRTVWIGTFDDNSRNRMYRFSIGPKGGLQRIGGPGNWQQVPKKSQGLAVTKDHFIFSTSHTSIATSNVYVIRRGKKLLDKAYPEDLTCFAAPSMSQGITLSNGKAFLSFESGSFRYRADPCDKGIFDGDCTRNVVTHLHRASRAALIGMT